MCNGTVIRARGIRAWSGDYWVVAHEGRIVQGPNYTQPENESPGGCGDHEEEIDSHEYEPYAPEGPNAGGTDGECAGGGDPSGEGAVCGGGEALYYDYMCIDVWNDATQRWEEWWCGVAAFCA